MKADTESRFESAQEYAAYLQTPEGRLRLDLAWSNLQPFLPSPSAGNNLKALDIGGGTGAMALKVQHAREAKPANGRRRFAPLVPTSSGLGC